MIVIITTNVKKAVHGIISRYCFQASKGVYVGNLDGRTRDQLFEYLSKRTEGTILCFYTTNNAQGYNVKAYGYTSNPIVEKEGLVFIKKNLKENPVEPPSIGRKGWSKNSYYRKKSRN